MRYDLFAIAFYALLFVIGLSLYLFIVSIHPPRFRSGYSPDNFGLPHETVHFKTVDNLTLEGWLVIKNKSRPTIIVGHGYPFDKSNIIVAAHFLYPEFNLFIFDFRYFGGSQGRYTTVGFKEADDVIAAIQYLKSRKDLNPSFGGYGFSMGAVAIINAQSRDISAIVADSPYADLDVMVKRTFWIFPGPIKMPFVWMTRLYAKLFLGVWPSEVSPKDILYAYHPPLLLIHGEKDWDIPVENSDIIYAASKKSSTEYWRVPGVRHGAAFAEHQDEYQGRVKSFFRKHLI